MPEVAGNRGIEDAGVTWVMELERSRGRVPHDTRAAGVADIESAPRLIEVKAYGGHARGEDLWLEPRQYEQATTNGNFYIYVVENVRQGDEQLFTLRVL